MKLTLSDPIPEEYTCNAVGEAVELSRIYRIMAASDGSEERFVNQTLCPKMDYCQLEGNWECPEKVYDVLVPEAQKNIRNLRRRGMKVERRS